ncbi:MAG: hypothetical protein F6J92_03025 [Symploca sp. SIO1A3]|nr:hypothetical protein [Symploca sp. SIO2C1]NER45666.1 hypothetical protein [Symploca sp. SIO1A3]
MASRKTQKIDLNTEYPCPCRRKGCLVPITLTEAFGCDRCQQIFVVEESGYVIEQLSTNYPYKKAWRWTGNRWNTANATIGENYLPVAILIVLVLLIVWLPLALHDKDNIIFWALLAVLLALLPALMVWLTYRR